MGNFYTNFTVKTGDADDVLDTLRQASRQAIVSPAIDGYVIAFDARCDDQDVDEIQLVGQMLSKQHSCVVFAALNHDDDIFCYWLYDKGKLLDSYNSAPDYFDDSAGADRGGDVETLCKAFGKPTAVPQVNQILQNDEYVFELERHTALLEALALPTLAVGTGFRYLEAGEAPDGFSEDDFQRTE